MFHSPPVWQFLFEPVSPFTVQGQWQWLGELVDVLCVKYHHLFVYSKISAGVPSFLICEHQVKMVPFPLSLDHLCLSSPTSTYLISPCAKKTRNKPTLKHMFCFLPFSSFTLFFSKVLLALMETGLSQESGLLKGGIERSPIIPPTSKLLMLTVSPNMLWYFWFRYLSSIFLSSP